MAVNVVIALYYYLQWTAVLFRAPLGAEEAVEKGAEEVAAAAVPVPRRAPAPVTVTIALTAVVGVILSGYPQLVLRFAADSLF